MDPRPSRDGQMVELDPDQRAAVESQAARLVMLGAAGTGKTAVVVERAARLRDWGVPKDRTLILAPSRRSLDEVTARLAGRLGPEAPAAVTFHALAFNLMHRHWREAGYPHPPRRLSAPEAWQQLKRALEGEDPADWCRYGGALRSRSLQALVGDLIAGAANNLLEPEEVEAALLRHGRRDLVELVGFHRRYGARQRQEGVLSPEGAVVEAVRLLERRPELAAAHRRQYQHTLVDEFEEATFAQARLLELLAGEGLFVAGNPDQGINSFQGGSPAHLREMAGRPGSRVVRLANCHRSTPPIQRACRRILSGTAPEPEDEPIPPESVEVRAFQYQREEAGWIAREIRSLLRSGVESGEVAVLFRSASDPVARELSRQLLRLGIPVRPLRGTTAVGLDPMVGAAMGVLRLLLTEEGDRNTHFLQLAASPLGDLTPAEAIVLRRAAREAGLSALELARDAAALDSLPLQVARRAADLASGLASLEPHRDAPPDELLWLVWRSFPAFARQAVAWGEGRLEECAGSPAAYRALVEECGRLRGDTPSLSAADVLLLFDAGHFREVEVPAETGRGGGVTLATIHQARGREWRHVFLPDLVEEVYPLRRSPIGTLAPLLLRPGEGEPEGVRDRHLAEERRLLYVALSRARERVHLSHSAVAFDGGSRLVPSRYLLSLSGPYAQGDSVLDSPDAPLRKYREIGDRTGDTPGPTDGGFTPAGQPREPSATLPGGAGDPTLEEMVALCRRRLREAGEPDSGEGDLEAAAALHTLGRLTERFPDRVDPTLWWELLEETRGAAPPYPEGRLYLSASRLASYRDCPLRFKFAQHLRLDDVSSDAMTLGSLLHGVLEEYHRPGTPRPRTREALEGLLEEKFDPAAFSRPAMARQLRRRASELLSKYFSRYGQQGEAVAVEIPFRFPLGPHTVSGRIDRIDRLPDGSLELIDYKTGDAMPHDEARSDLQLALYDLAFLHCPDLSALGSPSVATYLYPKAIGKRQSTDGRRSYRPDEDARQRLLARIDRYSRGILAELFPSRFHILDFWSDLDADDLARLQKSDPCRVCAFQWLCPEQERGTIDG